MNSNSNIERLLSQILMAIGGTNAMGVPNSALVSGKSIGHAYTESVRAQHRNNIVTPMYQAVLNMGGAQIYENSLRLLGYSAEAARAKATNPTDTSSQIMRHLGGMWVEQQAGNDIRYFANKSYESLYRFTNAPTDSARKSYGQLGAEIFRGVSVGAIGEYTLGEAYRMGGELLSTARYSAITDDKQRINKIKHDLKTYARGVSDLKDALGGSLEEVLASFESLSGSSAALTGASRFNSLSRAVYQTKVYGGASNELLSTAVATQHAYFQGTGTTQAHALAAGSLTAHILSKGVTVEGTNADEMEDALKSQNRQWLTTGRTRELAAAYSWYANTKGLELNQDTFQSFVKHIGGSATAEAVQTYLVNNQVSGAHINSDMVRRTMGQAEVTEGLMKADVYDKYKNLFNDAVKNGDLRTFFVEKEDIGLSNTDLEKTVKQRYLDNVVKNGGTINDKVRGEATLAAIQAVEKRSALLDRILPGASNETKLALVNNTGIALQERSKSKEQGIAAYKKDLANVQSIDGLEGVFTKMIQKGEGVANIKDVLSGFYGVTVTADMEKELRRIQGIKDGKKQEEQMHHFMQTRVVESKDGSNAEEAFLAEGKRRLSYTDMELELDKRITKSNKDVDSRKTWLSQLHAGMQEGASKKQKEKALEAIGELGDLLSEEEEFDLTAQIKDQQGWSRLSKKDKQTVRRSIQIAKEWGIDKESERSDFASIVKTIKSTAMGTEENDKARKELLTKIKESDKFEDRYGKAADDLKGAAAARIASGILGETYNHQSTEDMLQRIMVGVDIISRK